MGIPLNIGDQATYSAIWGSAPGDPTATWATSNPAIMSISTAGPSATCTVAGVAAGDATLTLHRGACAVALAFTVGGPATAGNCSQLGFGAGG